MYEKQILRLSIDRHGAPVKRDHGTDEKTILEIQFIQIIFMSIKKQIEKNWSSRVKTFVALRR